ncbi:hypothetical protein bcgnr5378_66820 [Bacillus cereus]|jgi:hypothetical protein
MKKAILASLLVSSVVIGCEKEDTSKEATKEILKLIRGSATCPST